MKSIEVSDLKEQVLLADNEALSIEHKGKVLGYFYPVKTKDLAQIEALWERLDAVLEQAATESGMDREALIDALDPSKPFPFEPS